MSVRRRDRRNADIPVAKSTKKEPIRIFAEKVRDHKDFDSRWAVLEEVRVEYFRSKDFVELLKKHPGLMAGIVPEDVPVVEENRASTAAALLLRGLIVRCDRAVKTIRQGRKKLSKWPAKLEVHSDQVFAEDGFYAWNYEKTRPIWQTALSFLVPVVTVACCLFPVFPHWAKLTVLYTCLSFLILICGVLLVRWVVFGGIWILTGRSVWFLPNILAEEALLSDLFRFMPLEAKEEEPPSKLLTRFVVALFTAGVVWLSFTHAPDGKARARYRKKVGNIIDDVLLWSPTMLAGNTSAGNATIVPPKPKTGADKPSPKPKLNDSELAEEAARIIREAGLLSEDDLSSDVGLESESLSSEERAAEEEEVEVEESKPPHSTEL